MKSFIIEERESPYPYHFAVDLRVLFNPDTVDLDDEASAALLQHIRDTVRTLEEELAEWLDLDESDSTLDHPDW